MAKKSAKKQKISVFKTIENIQTDILILGFFVVLIIVAVLALHHGQAEIIETGDTVKIFYTGMYEDESVFQNGTTSFTIGEGKIIKGLENAVLGMVAGEQKTVFIPKEDAYGEYNLSRLAIMNRTAQMNKLDSMPTAEFEKLTKNEIAVGRVIHLQTLPWKVIITHIDREDVNFEHKPVLDSIYYDPLIMNWPIIVTGIGDETIEFKYSPKLGNTMVQGGRTGRVILLQPDKITIDFNHELAGRDLIFDIEILEIEKAGSEYSD